jgi:hypothetical protein
MGKDRMPSPPEFGLADMPSWTHPRTNDDDASQAHCIRRLA